MLRHLIEFCVHRRLATVVTAIITAAFGVRAYLDTAIEAYPDVTNAQVNVIAQLPGYAPEDVERRVTLPLERTLNGTPGMTVLRSESLFGLSLVTLTFSDDSDSFTSRQLVAQRLAEASLPDGVTPFLAPDATPLGEIFLFRLVSDRHDLYELRSTMQWEIARVLRQVEGVADVLAFGGYLKEIHIEVDPRRLDAWQLSLADVAQALGFANLNVGGGFLRHGDEELTVRSVGGLTSPEQIKQVSVVTRNGIAVTVGDLADVTLAAQPRRGSVGWNDQLDAVEGFALLRRGQNPSRVLDRIHAQVRALNESILPEGMKIEVFYDRSELVAHTLSTVHDNLLHGFVLVAGVVWLFLRSWVGSAIVAVVIPLSLLVAFIGLHALGLPANLISMGAIDFGIIVDGSVVLVERVLHGLRHCAARTRRERIRIVIDSALSVARPTVFSLFIIIAALIPIFALQSVEGRIFRPLALTYSFALLGALVATVTLVPALCAFGFRSGHSAGDPRWIGRLAERYRSGLSRVLECRALVAAGGAVLLLLGALAASRAGTEFLPELDEGDIDVVVEMPPSIALEEAQRLLLDIRKRLLAFPEVLQVLTEHGRPEDGTDNEGANMAENYVRLRPSEGWRSGWDKPRLIEAMRASLNEIPGIEYNFSQPIKDNVEESLSGVRGKVVLKIYGDDLVAMRASLLEAEQALHAVPGIVELDLYREAQIPQLQIEPDRTALARADVSMGSVQETIETALAGRVVTEVWEGERPVPVRLILPKDMRDDLVKVRSLLVQSPSGGRLPLAELASIDIVDGVASITREAGRRFLALKFNVEGRDLGSAVAEAIAVVGAQVKPPPGTYFSWGGEFENQERAIARLRLVIPVAGLLVLALLYGALNSGRSALAILGCVPTALTGGCFALLAAGTPISVSAAIGFIALLGQVSLTGVLMLSAVEERRRAGMPTRFALVAGCTDRLRPVLLASLLALLGLLPMALSSGVGSETQRPFALVVVGGMITTLLVTLFVLPVLYGAITPNEWKTPEQEDEA